MANNSHLEQMGKELTCPICLSLLNAAVSITCNHAFCNSCIKESMRSDSTCPVCKIPYRRREVRPAPHMDTLVTIYKSMEVSSGVNTLVTQTAPPTKSSGQENQVEDGVVSRSEKTCRSTSDPPNQRRNKNITSKGSLKNRSKCCGSNLVRPSFPTKKRVQVPQHHPEESPTRLANPEAGKRKLCGNGSQINVFEPESRAPLRENGAKLFSPFFWLREEDAEITTPLLDGDPVNDSPLGGPCFSDIKDSDDDPRNMISREEDTFDSEMFEWTQRACSPELFSSPIDMQNKVTDGNERLQEKEETGPLQHLDKYVMPEIENEDTITLQKDTHEMEMMLPSSYVPQIRKASPEGGTKRSKKRATKGMHSMQKKKVKRAADEVIGVCTVFQREAGHEKYGDSVEPVNLKEQIRQRGKKAGIDGKSIEALITKVTTVCDGGKTSNQVDGSIAGLSDLFNLKECNSRSHKSNSIGKNMEVTIDQQHSRARRMKRQALSKSENKITESNKAFISQLPSELFPVNDEIKVCNSGRQTRNHEVKNSKDLKSLRRVTFARNESFKVKSGDGISSTREKVATQECQPLKEVRSSSCALVKNDSNALARSNAKILRKCDRVSDIQCTFCHSSEESNLSGLMVHYLKGKLVAANHGGESSIIHAHRNCTEWAPNVYFEDNTAINLESELARSRRIKCCCCGIKGAALGCYEKSCRKSFHFPCAKLTPQCRWDEDNFVMLCPLHVTHKLPNEAYGSQLGKKKKCAANQKSVIKQSQAVITDAISTTSLRDPQGPFVKIILCCSALTRMEKETIVKFERSSGVTILKTWDSRVTHVIASTDENGAGRRTLKYLMGILEGKWIVTIEWIRACMEVNEPVDEQLYEINIDTHGVRNGPRLGRSRLLSKESKLFNGYKFYFTGDFVDSYKGYLRDLVIAAGGVVLYRKPVPVDHEPPSFKCRNALTFIIYSLELPDKCSPDKTNLILNRRKSDAEALSRSTGAFAVSNSWILNSIAACKLQNIAD